MPRTHVLTLLLCLLLSPALVAQVTLGSLPHIADAYFPTAPRTLIAYDAPALKAGTVNTVTVSWRTFKPCTAAFKIKVLRGINLTYTTVAERGPFDAPTGGYLTYTFDPINVQLGDVLAVTQLKTVQDCGAFYLSSVEPQRVLLNAPGDIPASGSLESGFIAIHTQLAARLSSSGTVVDGIIPVAGSAAGANNTFFRTSLQLSNPDVHPLSGRLVFHPAGAPASPNDPTLAYNLAPHATVSFADVVSAFNVSGLGSIDIVPNGSAAPWAVARIYNDLGTAGTQGFTLPAASTEDALQVSTTSWFMVSNDLTNYRMNVGVRTLDDPVTLSIVATNSSGTTIATASRSYPANFFSQVSLADFIGTTPQAGSLVRFFVGGGRAIVYASTTDNRTGDSAVVLAGR